MRFDGIIFDFDGVLVESEYAGNLHLAETLTGLGHPTSVEQSLDAFVGLGGKDFLAAIERWVDGPVPSGFHALRRAEDERAMREGVGAVAGAVAFVRALPPALPKAIASSSSTEWIRAHLAHLGLADAFGDHVYSGREHVARGKPAPDLYLHAARAIGVDIAKTLVIEDSPVGVTGAVASGAYVIGLAAGRHCGPGHAERLRERGAHEVVTSFAEIRI
ncbi:MAG: HAD family phosphatase [Sphingomonadaceae bacterium]|nr:HAD family phosphatase [Sphingomonadaceae bacterium]